MAVDPTDTEKYPLGSDNLFILQRNASDVDKFSNSEEDAIENRFGKSLGTIDYYNRQFQAAVDSIEVSTTEAEGFADDAEASATAAAASETSSELNAQASASSANIVGSWEGATGAGVAFTSYTYQGNSVWMLAVGVADITTSEPSTSNSDWIIVSRPYEAVPYPDLHIPFNDGLRIESGYGTHDQIDVSAAQDGSVMVDLPSMSVDFTRNSTVMYIDKSGVKQTADINEPAITKKGIWVHPSFINLHTYSEFDGGYPFGGSNDWGEQINISNITFQEFIKPSVGYRDYQVTAGGSLAVSCFIYVGNLNDDEYIVYRAEARGDSIESITVNIYNDGRLVVTTGDDAWSREIEMCANDVYRVHLFYSPVNGFANDTCRIAVYPTSSGSAPYYGGFQTVSDRRRILPYVETQEDSVLVAGVSVTLPAKSNFPAPGDPFSIIADTALGYTSDQDYDNKWILNLPGYVAYRDASGGDTLYARVGGKAVAAEIPEKYRDSHARHVMTYENNIVSLYVEGSLIWTSSIDVDFSDYEYDSVAIIGAWTRSKQFGNAGIKGLKVLGTCLSALQVASLGGAE